jgi:hypothetical protein
MKNTRKKHLYKKTLKSRNRKSLKSRNRKSLKSRNRKSLKSRNRKSLKIRGGGFLSWLGSAEDLSPAPPLPHDVPGEIQVETKFTNKQNEFLEKKSKEKKERDDAIRKLQTTQDPTKLSIAILEAIVIYNIFSGSQFKNAIKNLEGIKNKENDENLKQEMGKVLTLANRANTLYKERMKIQNDNMSDKQQKLTINTGERDKVKEDAKNLLNNLLMSS